eukprot:6254082-Prorocentrum_lima.AAC.1
MYLLSPSIRQFTTLSHSLRILPKNSFHWSATRVRVWSLTIAARRVEYGKGRGHPKRSGHLFGV